MLECNADTSTSRIESAIAQWNWQQELHPDADQFNSLLERLTERWRDPVRALCHTGPMHFAGLADHEEDLANLDYLRDIAIQAGIDYRFIAVQDIGWDERGARFVDLDSEEIRALFKLYPSEWMIRESFGPHLLAASLKLVEPPGRVC